MSVKERLKAFIKSRKMGQGAFEKEVGLSNGYVNNIRQSIQPDKLQKIALRFPELNTGWLMTGDGEMIKDTHISAGGHIVNGEHNRASGDISVNDMISHITRIDLENEYLKKEVELLKSRLDDKDKLISALMKQNE